MGRRRSSALLLGKKLKDTARQLKLRRIKSHSGLQCPKCYNYTMFVAEKGKLLVLVGCTHCQLGELLPKHPTWKAVDLYHCVVDNWRNGKVPEFKYNKLPEKVYDFLQDNVTLGRIVCPDIIPEEDEE